MLCRPRQAGSADTVPRRRALVHTIRGCSVELVVALAGQYRLICVRQPLEESLLRKRCVFHVRAAPEALIIQNGDNRAKASVDYERRARVAIALEIVIVIDVGGHEPLRPRYSVERATADSADRV